MKPTSATPAAPAPSPGGAIRNLAIGLVVSAIFLYFTFRTVDLRKMAEAMRQVDGLILGLSTV